ncbi:MAG TPA: hypothetical protein VKG45_02365 [Actinomycetes bacterium]|nr:hypothetical protein [Actinomycetes bacterium]
MPTTRTPGPGMPSAPGPPVASALFLVRTDDGGTRVTKVAPGEEPALLRWLELQAPGPSAFQRVVQGQEIGRQLPAPQQVRPATRIATAIGYLATALTRQDEPFPAVDLNTLGLPGSMLVARSLPSIPGARPAPPAAGPPGTAGRLAGVIALVPSRPGSVLTSSLHVTLPESVRVEEASSALAEPPGRPRRETDADPWATAPGGEPLPGRPPGRPAAAVHAARAGRMNRDTTRSARSNGAGDPAPPDDDTGRTQRVTQAGARRRWPPARTRLVVAVLAAGLCAAVLLYLAGIERSSARRPAVPVAGGDLPATTAGAPPGAQVAPAAPASTASTATTARRPPPAGPAAGPTAQPPRTTAAEATGAAHALIPVIPAATASAAERDTNPAATDRQPGESTRRAGGSPRPQLQRTQGTEQPDPVPTTTAAAGGGPPDPGGEAAGPWRYQVEGTCAGGGCGLKVRTSPALDAPAIQELTDGDPLDVACQALGAQVGNAAASSAVWNRLAGGGWVPDLYVSTPGGGFSPPIPAC